MVMLLVAVAVTASAVWIYPQIGQELVPDDDQGEFNVSINLPRGTSLDRTMEYVNGLEDTIRNLPEVQTVFTSLQPNQANYFVGMTPLESREISQQELMRGARDAHQPVPRTGHPSERIRRYGYLRSFIRRRWR